MLRNFSIDNHHHYMPGGTMSLNRARSKPAEIESWTLLGWTCVELEIIYLADLGRPSQIEYRTT